MNEYIIINTYNLHGVYNIFCMVSTKLVNNIYIYIRIDIKIQANKVVNILVGQNFDNTI